MARVSSIIDPNTNRPVVYDDMTKFIAAPSLGSVRNDLSMGASRNLTPQRLANLLRGAEQDNPEPYLSLAEEMEEKDLHYLSVLGTRKRQVAQLPITLSAASKDARDEEIAKDVQENLLDTGIIDAVTFDMLDAIGKGFSLTELRWEIGANKWLPVELQWVNPRFVRFDRETQRVPHLVGNNGELLPLALGKFAYLENKAKSGLALRGGLARPVAWAYMFKNFALKDWVQFCEVYGIPWRIGSYDQAASPEDQSALLRAVCSLSSDAAAIKPKNMDIEVVESGATTASSALYGDLAKYFDDQVSKAVLGQTRTVDATPGNMGGGDEGTEVREDIERADAKKLAACINRDIIRVYVDFNYGPQPRYPAVTIGRVESKNAQLMVDAAQKLGGGMKIRAADIREAVGFAEPQDNDELYVAPAAAAPYAFGGFPTPAPTPTPANDPAPAARPSTEALDPAIAEISLNGIQVQAVLDVVRQLISREIPEGVGAALIAAVGIPEVRAKEMAAEALRQPQPSAAPAQAIAASMVRATLLAAELEGGADAIALAAQQQAKTDAELLKPMRDQILRIAALSSGYDDFRRRLALLKPDLDMTPLVERLAGLTFQSLAGGVVGDTLKK